MFGLFGGLIGYVFSSLVAGAEAGDDFGDVCKRQDQVYGVAWTDAVSVIDVIAVGGTCALRARKPNLAAQQLGI
jgi:uncharacterized membrane protein (UPF0136 family)